MYRLHKPIFTQRGAYGPVMALSPAAWYRPGIGVTGTLTASNWADQSGNGRDLAQASAGNQPIYLPYSGTAYGYLPGVGSNYFSTPDSAANSITGDIDIRVKVAMDDWTPSATKALVAKYVSGGNQAYQFAIETGGVLRLIWDYTGSNILVADSTVAPTVSDGATLWVRVTLDVDNGASGNTTTFYASSDGATWTQLGNTVVKAGTTSIYNSTAAVEIGSVFGGTANLGTGKIYSAQIYNGINGTLAVDFNPSTFAETSTNAATAVAATGETWTLNSTGTLPARVVKSPMLLGEGTARKMATTGFTLDQPVEHFIVAQPITWTAADYLLSGAGAEAGLTQVTSTPQIGLNAGSAAAANGDFALGAFAIVHAAINGASSSVTVNNGTAATGDAGAGNPGGLTLFSNQGGTGYFNGAVKEWIVTNATLSAAERLRVKQWLATRHSISL